MKRLGVAVATAGGAGYFPFAPGTVGSAIGLVIYWAVQSWSPAAQAAVIAVIVVAGLWAGGVAAAHFGREDPGHVIIDEVAGQLLALMATAATGWGLFLGFVLFRILDIVKPWPARQFERFPRGYGIMADDLMAGVYANVLLRIAQWVAPGVF
jgi:phosphatidylglycerophosphatase A